MRSNPCFRCRFKCHCDSPPCPGNRRPKETCELEEGKFSAICKLPAHHERIYSLATIIYYKAAPDPVRLRQLPRQGSALDRHPHPLSVIHSTKEPDDPVFENRCTGSISASWEPHAVPSRQEMRWLGLKMGFTDVLEEVANNAHSFPQVKRLENSIWPIADVSCPCRLLSWCGTLFLLTLLTIVKDWLAWNNGEQGHPGKRSLSSR